MARQSDTEEKILDAARKIFQRAGYDGARMQSIADEAGINKALLHYYYRTKDRLFQDVFRESLKRHLLPITGILRSERLLEEKIPDFVKSYIDTMIAHPFIPGFILHEIAQNPERLQSFVTELDIVSPGMLIQQIRKGIQDGRYNPVDPRQFLVHMMSLTVFPFVGRPMIQTVFQIEDQGYRAVLEKRKEIVPEVLLNLLLKK